MRYRYAIFDLDGTLTDNQEGITKCVSYALEQCAGLKDQPYADLLRFIGPPLTDSFREFYGMSEEEAQQATATYRERYSVVGWAENRVYPGIPKTLQRLKAAGVKLGVATSKPQEFTEWILKKLELDQYFDAVCGARMDNAHSTKREMILRAIERLGGETEAAVMIGDRKFDLVGAAEAGVDSIFAAYGFGPIEEAADYGAGAVAGKPEAIADLILQ